jgi:hypothetical protein
MWFIFRRGLLAVAAVVCWVLTPRLGFWMTLGLWTLVSGVVCLASALVLRSAGVGQMGWKNYQAGFFLQFGYAIGKGMLPGITLVSWLVWTLIGLAAALAASRNLIAPSTPDLPGPPAAAAGVLGSILLMLAWVIDGGIILYTVGVIAKNFQLRSQQAKHLLAIIGILLAVMGISLFAWRRGYTYTAALIAGGPPLALGVFFGLYVLIILTAGKNARWN